MQVRGLTDTIVLHHSASPASTTREQIRIWHITPKPKGRGFGDIGYHVLVFSDGHVEPGRAEHLVGAHCDRKCMNFHSLGVCLVGHFDDRGGGDAFVIPDCQWQAALFLVSELCRQYSIPRERVYGHRELDATECPGFDASVFRGALAERGTP